MAARDGRRSSELESSGIAPVATVAYAHPLVPSEWIEAHGPRPRWIVPQASAEVGPAAGMCPYAWAVAETLSRRDETTFAVLTTTCDQMRRAAGLLAEQNPESVFLLDVPAQRLSPASRAYYASELQRLSRWLIDRGGQRPSADRLAEVMASYEKSREGFRRGTLPSAAPAWCNPNAVELATDAKAAPADAVRLGIVGGPLRRRDVALARQVSAAGGRIVLDATCGGNRTLPDRFRPAAMAKDPFDELVRAYFDGVVAISKHSNDRLYAWCAAEIERRDVQGLLCLRYVWCDLWHVATSRLKETAGVPILEIDLGDDGQGDDGRNAGRIEALLELIRQPAR